MARVGKKKRITRRLPSPEVLQEPVSLPLEQQVGVWLDVQSGKRPIEVAKFHKVSTEQVMTVVRTFEGAIPRSLEGEVSFASQFPMFGGYRVPQFNPSMLVTRKGLEIFDQMRNDDQVKAALEFKKLACMATGWEVTPPDEKSNPEAMEVKVAEHALKKVEGSFQDSLMEILTALDFGYSVSEIVYQQFEEGDYKDWIGVRAIKTRRPHDIDFIVDPYGNLDEKEGIVQRAAGQAYGEIRFAPEGKFVIYTHQKEFSNFYGRSDLEACYRGWWIKENAYRWLAMLLERFGIPPIFALYDPRTMTPNQTAQLVKVIQHLQAATAGAIPRPSPEALELWAPELAGQVNQVFVPALELLDKNIARALLMPGLLGATPQGNAGSFAQAKVQFDVFMLVVEKIRKQLADNVVNDQILRPLHFLNFGTKKKPPIFKFLPLTDDIRVDLFTAWTGLLEKGAVKPQDSDEDHIRSVFGFPERSDDDERRDAPPPGMPDPNDPNAGGPGAPGQTPPDPNKKKSPGNVPPKEGEDEEELEAANRPRHGPPSRPFDGGLRDPVPAKINSLLEEIKETLEEFRDINRFPAGNRKGGQFAPKGSSGSPVDRPQLHQVRDRAWEGDQKDLRTEITKQQAGALGEQVAVQWLKDQGFADAAPLNMQRNNFPVDLVHDHEVIEVKTGLASNSTSAQQWRATIGQPGPTETAWLKKASPEAKARWNEKKQAAIMKRKQAVVNEFSKRTGKRVKGRTLGIILDPDRGVADIYSFDGFHSRIGWKSEQAQAGYVGSFRYNP